MVNKRLFTFGCSNTGYKWPTWADIIGLNFDEFYNFGEPGSGTFFSLYQFVYANEYYKFTKDDTLIFMLSNEARIDIIKNKRWFLNGLVFNAIDEFGKKFFEHYSEIHAVESSYIYVYFLKEMLDKIGCKYEIITAFRKFYGNKPHLFDDFLIKICHKQRDELTNKNIESLTEFASSIKEGPYTLVYHKTGEKYLDGHYKISTHLKYVKKYLSDYYDEKYDEVVIGWENMGIENYIDNDVQKKFWNIIKKNKVMFINGKIKNDFLE
jgi:hypothetical protein